MLKIKSFIIVVILSILLAACQANPIGDQVVIPVSSPYPSPEDVVVGQGTSYPISPDMPVTQETAYPYPEIDSDQADSGLEPAYAPKPEDAKLERGVVFPNVGDSGILLLESFPV